MTFDQLIAVYVSLLIMQYNLKPKAQATISTLVSAAVAKLIYQQVENAFDITTAVGAQLDILAKYVGAQRIIYGLSITKVYFQFRYAADLPPPATSFNGMADVSNPITSWFFLTVRDFDASVITLTDGQLSTLIQYLADVESLDFTVQNVDDIFVKFFGTYVTWVDNFNMTMTVTHDQTNDPNTLFETVKFLGALPRPAGVSLSVVEI